MTSGGGSALRRFAAILRVAEALVLAAVAGFAGAAGNPGREAHAQLDRDAAAWAAARAAGTAEACQGYLQEFPTGRYAEAAFRCIVEQALPGAGPAPGPGVAPGADLY